MNRKFCYHTLIASVVILVIGAPASAKEAEPDKIKAPASAKVTVPDKIKTPATAKEVAPDKIDTPASAKEAAPDKIETPASAKVTVPGKIETPASATEVAPEKIDTPASAKEVAPDKIGAPATAKVELPKRDRKTRSDQKDAEADSHTPKPQEDSEKLEHYRGVVTKVDATSMEVKIGNGNTVHLKLFDDVTVITLSKGSFTAIDFGVYVGAVAVKLDEYSPIVRDSLSWLHRGYELRLIDEALRGIALGHKKWDLTSESIIAHGWIDDIEGRVISIKYGPTEIEETDVETPRGAPVLKMSLGDKKLIKRNARIFAGAQKGNNGEQAAVFVFVGKDGIVPPL